MKVLLIQPPKAARALGGEDYYAYEPLSLEYLAAGLRAHHDVTLLDMRFDADLVGALERFRPQVVGVTAYTVHVNSALTILSQVRAWDPRVLNVVGGHHATVRPQDFCHHAVDLVVVGEGVVVLRQAIERHERGQGWDEIPGLYAVRAGELVGTPAGAAIPLDEFPFPDRSVSAPYRARYFSEWMRPLAALRTSKGCPHRCTFCALWRLTGGRYLKRSPGRVVEELAQIEEENVFFADDESMIDAKNMAHLADAIAGAGLRKRFFLYGRSDTIARHPELLERWRAVGLERVFVGLEFFRDQDMQAVNKRSSVRENEQALAILHRLGIEAYANFMVRQEFSRQDFRAFGAYCRGLPLSYAGFSVLTPLPGTELFEAQQEQLLTRDWDLFDFMHTVLPTRLPLREFYAEYAALIRRAISPGQGLAYLRRFPLREIPGVYARGARLLGRIRRAYLDHPRAAGEGQG